MKIPVLEEGYGDRSSLRVHILVRDLSKDYDNRFLRGEVVGTIDLDEEGIPASAYFERNAVLDEVLLLRGHGVGVHAFEPLDLSQVTGDLS